MLVLDDEMVLEVLEELGEKLGTFVVGRVLRAEYMMKDNVVIGFCRL